MSNLDNNFGTKNILVVSNSLINPKDKEELALTLNGKKSNIKLTDFKELAESRKETIELLREKVCNLEGQIDELKKAKESSYSGYRVAEDGPELSK